MTSARRRLAAALLASLLATLPAAAQPTPSSSPALTLVNAYNARQIGSPGWRRIFLELKNQGKVTRQFSILHLWHQDEREIRSLVYLEQPSGLAGTDYLLIEKPLLPDSMELYLRLPAGNRRVLAIRPSRFDEGLLGSDFGYSDLRWQIPTRGVELRLLGQVKMLGRTASTVELRPISAETRASSSWSRVRYYLSSEPALLGADFFAGDAERPAKQLRIEKLAQIDGVWTPLRMVMTLEAGRSSVLTLKETGFGASRFAAAHFTPETLPSLGERLAESGLLKGSPAGEKR